jgi:Lrp/AsnC family transcriptional regulator, regulator for asnA, asnC and gidA
MYKVDGINAAILRSLLSDGRKSYVDIANEVGTTKIKIWKHFKEMERKGIISGATVQMNYAALGFDALATLLISVEGEQLNQIMDYVAKITEVRAYRQYNSIYNIRAVTTLRGINELDHVKEVIRRRIPANGIRSYIWTAVRTIPENLSLVTNWENAEPANPEVPRIFHQETKVSVDELDLSIIEKLSTDGRAPFSQIADELGTSIDTVAKRYRRLKQDHVVKVSLQINPNLIDYSLILDFNIALKSPSNAQTIEALCRIPDIVIITKTSGDYDLQVTAIVRDIQHMLSIQDEIIKVPGINKMETSARKIPPQWPTAKQYISTF